MGHAEVAAMRKEGNDPNKTPSARKAVGDANREHQRARAAWNPGADPTDPEHFRTEILPRLQGCTPGELAKVVGLSPGYCGLILKGEKVPHPRHWRSLAAAVEWQPSD